MEETRGITVRVRESLHGKAKQEAEAKGQTMSQLIETVLDVYFNREDVKEMNGNKRTLAFQVSEEFFMEVQDYIKRHRMKLREFGITAMQRMLKYAPTESDTADTEAPTGQE